MLEYIPLSLAALAVYATALCGWGILAARWLHPGLSIPFSYAMALGASLWVALGGLLNMLDIATTAALTAILLSGVLAAGILTIMAARNLIVRRRGMAQDYLRHSLLSLVPSRENVHVWLLFSVTFFLVGLIS